MVSQKRLDREDDFVDPQIAELAGTAATTLVALLTTEGWRQTKEHFALLWRRVQPERAEAVARELEAAREDLVMAHGNNDPRTERELVVEWQGRIRRLLVAHPEAAGEFRAMLAELALEAAATQSVTQRATASGNARVYQAGRDQNFDQR